MRVLRLCSVYESPATTAAGFDAIGGMQVHTSRLTNALEEVGVAQTVVTTCRPGAERVQQVGFDSRVLRVGAPIKRFRQFYGIAAVPHVRALERVDLVHVHLGEDLAIVPLARWAARRHQAPLVATLHCSLRHTLVTHDTRSFVLRTLGGYMQSALVRETNTVFVLSDRLGELLVASGLPSERVMVIPLGIEIDATRQPRPASMGDGRWVVYVGRLVPEKGVRDLVSAFSMLQTPDIGMMLVGDGPERPSLDAFATGHGRRIQSLGAVPHVRVGQYLQHADVVVVPSWFEERGRVVLEAMAAGTPVVATRTGGIPSSVTHGVHGLLVEPRDPPRLAAAIDRVLCDPALATSMAVNGRDVASIHGIGALADATFEAYERALSRSQGGAPSRRGGHDTPGLDASSCRSL